MKIKCIIVFTVFLLLQNVSKASDTLRCYNSYNESEIFDRAEVMPKFPDGPQAMMSFIMSNTKFDVKLEDGIPEKVVIKLVIDKNGEVIKPKVLKSSGNVKFDEEVLRVIHKMPIWIPAKQRGTPVRCYYTIPFQFEFKQN